MSTEAKDSTYDLVDYEEEEAGGAGAGNGVPSGATKETGSYAGILEANFRDFLLKPEIMRAIGEAGFEHPSEVQQQAIPAAMNGQDLVCQAKSGMGKTAVFVLATLQQIQPSEDGLIDTLVLCHTRELAFQISAEFERFSKYLTDVRVCVVYGGVPFLTHKDMILKDQPHIVIGTPGRVLHLLKEGVLNLGKIKRFILDECDNMLEALDMRRQVQDVFKQTPHDKQVMMFSATISADAKNVCRKFTKKPNEIFVDDKKLTLHGLQQHFCKLTEKEKNRKLNGLLDALDFNQVVIFVRTRARAHQLNVILEKCAFPSMTIHANMSQEERLKKFQKFKDYKSRILVSTNLFGRGVDVERVNIVINYDMPATTDEYLHRVGRAGRFGTKGLAITFVSTPEEVKILDDIQKRFEVKITPLPDEIESSTYMN